MSQTRYKGFRKHIENKKRKRRIKRVLKYLTFGIYY